MRCVSHSAVWLACYRLTGESRRPAPKTYWAFDAFDPRRVITSSWLPTWVLLCTRVALCLYFVAGIAVEVSNGGSQGGSNDFPDWGWLRYFTNWAFAWLLCFQGVLGTALTTYYLRVSCKVGARGHCRFQAASVWI